jgi:hypothetical protein
MKPTPRRPQTGLVRSFRSMTAALLLALLPLEAAAPAFAADPGTATDIQKNAESARNKAKYRRSKLTYDESEETADRRRLLLTTGEDRAIDLDFEVNGGGAGIAIGNPTTVATTLVKIGEKRQIVFSGSRFGIRLLDRFHPADFESVALELFDERRAQIFSGDSKRQRAHIAGISEAERVILLRFHGVCGS